MDIENTFAAEVFNATRTAAACTAAGLPQSASDVIGGALSDIWAFHTAGHFSQDDIARIVDKYVRYDANDEPWPRDDIEWRNVVRLR